MKIRNVILGGGFEPTLLAFPGARMLTITLSRLPDAITVSIHNFLCGSLLEKSVQIALLLLLYSLLIWFLVERRPAVLTGSDVMGSWPVIDSVLNDAERLLLVRGRLAGPQPTAVIAPELPGE